MNSINLKVFLALCCFFYLSSIHGQSIGLQFGYNTSSILFETGSTRNSTAFISGMNASIIGRTELTKMISLSVEPGISSKGGISRSSATDPISFNFSYLLVYTTLPINTILRFGNETRAIELFAGPYAGYIITARSNNGAVIPTDSQGLSALDYGGQVGINIQYRRVYLGLEFSQGLKDINGDTMNIWRNRTFSIHAGLMLFKNS